MLVAVYCSGGIKKRTADNEKLCWTDVERTDLARSAYPHEVCFLNPDDPLDNLSDPIAVFGRDMYQIESANYVVVDARQRRGIGIGTEIVASKILGTPVIVVTPPNGHYRMDELFYRGSNVKNYIHPHLQAFTDMIVDDFAGAGSWIRNHIEAPQNLKSTNVIFEAIGRYKETLLSTDTIMLEILQIVQKVKTLQS